MTENATARATRRLVLLLVLACGGTSGETAPRQVSLPEPRTNGQISLEEAIASRRSVRGFSDEPITLPEVSQLLWAAQGITDPAGHHRAAPSAGALYPMETYLIAWNVDSLEPGVYRYLPRAHALEPFGPEVPADRLAAACYGQYWVSGCPATILLTAVFERTTRHYGDRGIAYVYMEAGHISENVYLQCVSLGLGTVAVGACTDEDVSALLGLPDDEVPLYLMPLGAPDS